MVPPLISTDQLAVALGGAAPPTLLDVRWSLRGPGGVADYERGHIPDARFVDLDSELAGAPGAGRHPLPDAASFQAAMRRHGVSARTPVVVYDAADGLSGARAWWTLRYFGHPAVQLLDGGIAAWLAEGRPQTTEVPTPRAGDFTASAGHMPALDAAGAAALARKGVLLDVRAPERYRGEVEPVDPVAGHIPGARSLPAAGNVDTTGRFLPSAQLAEHFAAAGIRSGVQTGAYCGSGVNAAQAVLALAVAGIPAALYVGSWSDWVTDRTRPVAVGAEP